jgi:hypothetical protein
MLPSALFSPLDLRDAIEETRRTSGPHGVVDLLISALTDIRVRDDSVIDQYLPELKSACRQSRRYGDAVAVLRRIAVLNPSRRHEVAAELAVVHGHLREPAAGIALLETALRAQRRLSVRRRSFSFFVVAEVAAAVLGRPALARDIALAGRNVVPATPMPWVEPPTLFDLTADAAIRSEPVRRRGRAKLVLVKDAA